MRCSRHRARKVASRTLPSTAEGSGGYPRGVFNTLSGASVLAANDPFGAGADLGFEKRCVSLAEQGLGLAYAPEPAATEHLRAGRLKTVLEAYAPTVPGAVD